jgi:hypothetical protein
MERKINYYRDFYYYIDYEVYIGLKSDKNHEYPIDRLTYEAKPEEVERYIDENEKQLKVNAKTFLAEEINFAHKKVLRLVNEISHFNELLNSMEKSLSQL